MGEGRTSAPASAGSSSVTSVSAGASSFRKSAPIRSCTSAVLPMKVKVPRPSRAASRMKWALGAEPMPTVNRRLAPRRSRIAAKSWASLPTAPSVRKITCRRRPARSCPSRARRSAGSISVPPWALSAATQRSAYRALSRVAGAAPANRLAVRSLKLITLKVSAGFKRPSASLSAARACSIDCPCIEPETSITKTTSRGTSGPAGPSGAGGTTIRRAKTSSPFRSAKSAASGAWSAAGSHTSSKSRSAGTLPASSSIRTRPAASGVVRIAWYVAPRLPSGTPGSSSTLSASGFLGPRAGCATGGVRREASGTASVSGAQPVPVAGRAAGAPGM